MDLSTACTVKPPKVILNISSNESPVGNANNITANIEIINNNEGSNCKPVSITTQLYMPSGFTLPPSSNSAQAIKLLTIYNNKYKNDNDNIITLKTNESATFETLIHIRENTLPKEYTLAIEASIPEFDIGKPSRDERTFTVQCPIPEAPNNVSFKQVASAFSKNRVMLTWKGCENELFCCCPCSWMVFRDGVYIGTSKERSFNDSFNLDEGVDYNYSVITVDAGGLMSPSDTCRNAVLVTGESADITTYVIIFASAAVFILTVITSIVVVLVYLNWEKIDSKLKIWKINALQKLFVLRSNQ